MRGPWVMADAFIARTQQHSQWLSLLMENFQAPHVEEVQRSIITLAHLQK